MKINIGDNVMLISDCYGVGRSNPVKGSEYECSGVVVSKDDNQGTIKVDWNNGTTNTYTEYTLSCCSRTSCRTSWHMKSIWPEEREKYEI